MEMEKCLKWAILIALDWKKDQYLWVKDSVVLLNVKRKKRHIHESNLKPLPKGPMRNTHTLKTVQTWLGTLVTTTLHQKQKDNH